MPMCRNRKPVSADDQQQRHQSRAARYRSLALTTANSALAKLLSDLAEEAERGVLCTSDWLNARTQNRKRL
jgi:hypothetical protein